MPTPLSVGNRALRGNAHQDKAAHHVHRDVSENSATTTGDSIAGVSERLVRTLSETLKRCPNECVYEER
jgi:hypothetical protein